MDLLLINEIFNWLKLCKRDLLIKLTLTGANYYCEEYFKVYKTLFMPFLLRKRLKTFGIENSIKNRFKTDLLKIQNFL